MAELSRGEELALRESNGDATASVVPTMRLSTVHPYTKGGDEVRNLTGEMYFFFATGCYWPDSAKGFGQVRGALIPNSSNCHELLIHHIFYMAAQIGTGLEDGLPRQIITWTNVPHKDDNSSSAGFLVRCTYQQDMAQVYKAQQSQISYCEGLSKTNSERNNTRFFDPRYTPGWRRLTHDAWVVMCNYYLKKPVGDHVLGFQDLDDPENPYNQTSVFSLENACLKMRRAGADLDFCLPQNYLSGESAVLFPRNGDCTYKLQPSQLNVVHIRKIYMPHASSSAPVTEGGEYFDYLRDAGLREDGEMIVDDEAEDGLSNGERLAAAQQNYARMATCSDADEGNTLLSFKKRVTKRMAQARTLANGDPKQEAINRRAAQLELIRVFDKEIFTEDETADVGDALHALAKWKNDFLRTHHNFCMPTSKRTSNLTRFAEWQTFDADLSETAFAINTAHQEVKSIWLASMHVYFYSPFHSHTCLLGPAGAGKSNTFNLNEKKCIPGTVRDIGSETAKAKMTPGKKTDLSIETFEDIPPSQMGVTNSTGGSYGGAGSTSMTSNTDAESMLKYRLTKGRVKGVYKLVQHGVHMMVEVDSHCNTVMLVGMNATLSQVPKAISDRFNNVQFQLRGRTGFSGSETCMYMKHQLAQDRSMDRLKHDAYKRFHRNQLFHAIIELLCWAGVFEQPDLTVPVLVWSHTLAKAHEKGLQETTNVRHFERLKFHCETLVVEDAIDRVLDSKNSPINRGSDAPFRLEDI